MTENLKAFFEKVSNDKDLRDEIIKLNLDYPDMDANIEQLIQLAKRLDLEIAADDFVNDREADEINDENLDNIAGGSYVMYKNTGGSDCFCFLGGGGTADEYQKICACVAAGAGELTEEGKERARAGTLNYIGSIKAPVALACGVWGFGAP